MTQAYLYISIIIGLVLIIDAVILKRVNGKCGAHPILSITTRIELLWAVASAIALYELNFSGWSVLVPSLYLAHNVFGWCLGFFLVSKNLEAAKSKNFFVPIWYVYICGAVGLIFSVVSTFAVL